MLQIRLAGAEAEARAFLGALAAAGVEVQIGGVRDRGDFAHLYAVVRMPAPGGRPAADETSRTSWPAPEPSQPSGPVRATAYVGRALEGRRSRSPRRRG